MSEAFDAVIESAAKLQHIVPDLVLVGGTAAAIHAKHRESLDHDHVLEDLEERYSAVVDAVEATDGWATSVRASHPPLTLMGSLDGVEGGIRQLRRTKPLEVEEVLTPSGQPVRVPTLPEILRIKAFLIVDRGAVRDFLDVAALATRLGQAESVRILRDIDEYYQLRSQREGDVLTELTLALAQPRPVDTPVIDELPRYKGLAPHWHEWSAVTGALQALALDLAGSNE
jgi:hypothetical protein